MRGPRSSRRESPRVAGRCRASPGTCDVYPARAAACARSDGRAPRAAAARPQRAPNMNTRRRLSLAAVYGEIADHMQLRARSRSRSRRAAPRPAPEASPAAAAADLQTAQAAPAANQSAAACVAAAAAATAVDQSVATVAPAAAGSTAATAAAVKWPRPRTFRPHILPAAAAAELQTAAVAVAAVAPQAAAAANQSAAACTAAAAAATAVDQSVATVALAAAGSTAATAAAVKWPRPRTLTRAAKLGKDDVVDTLLTSIGSGESSVAQVARLAAPLARRRGDGALLQLASFRERDLHPRCAKQPWREALPKLYAFSVQKSSARRAAGRLRPQGCIIAFCRANCSQASRRTPQSFGNFCSVPRLSWKPGGAQLRSAAGHGTRLPPRMCLAAAAATLSRSASTATTRAGTPMTR